MTFVDGDPDRPLVIGCVNNATNPTPGLLPVQATKSVIRTRTVPHGPGYNEISFEDAMGVERVHIRAERDLDELVLHNHTTSVHGRQFNQVGGDQRETILGHQLLDVSGHRRTRVSGNERLAALHNRYTQVGGTDSTHVHGDQELVVETGSAHTRVMSGDSLISVKGTLLLSQDDQRSIRFSSHDDDNGIRIEPNGASIHVNEEYIEIKVGRSSIRVSDGVIRVNNKTFPAE